MSYKCCIAIALGCVFVLTGGLANAQDEGPMRMASSAELAPPVLSVGPENIELDVDVDMVKTFRITIKNRGGRVLQWSLASSPRWAKLESLRSGKLGYNSKEDLIFSVDTDRLKAPLTESKIVVEAPGVKGSPVSVTVALRLVGAEGSNEDNKADAKTKEVEIKDAAAELKSKQMAALMAKISDLEGKLTDVKKTAELGEVARMGKAHRASGWSFGITPYCVSKFGGGFGGIFVEKQMGVYSLMVRGLGTLGLFEDSALQDASDSKIYEPLNVTLRRYFGNYNSLLGYAQGGVSFLDTSYAYYSPDMGMMTEYSNTDVSFMLGGGVRYRPGGEGNLFYDAGVSYFPAVKFNAGAVGAEQTSTDYWTLALSMGYSFGDGTALGDTPKLPKPRFSVIFPGLGVTNTDDDEKGGTLGPVLGIEWHITNYDSLKLSALTFTEIEDYHRTVGDIYKPYFEYDETWRIAYRRYIGDVGPVQGFVELGYASGEFDTEYRNEIGDWYDTGSHSSPILGVGLRVREGGGRFFCEMNMSHVIDDFEYGSVLNNSDDERSLTTTTFNVGMTF